MAATALEPQQSSAYVDGEVDTQLQQLQDQLTGSATELAAALAKLCVLLPHASEQALASVQAHLQQLVQCLGVQDEHAQANACAVLTAAACQSEELTAAVSSAAQPVLLELLLTSTSSSTSSQWRINLFSLLGQLARETEPVARSLADPAALAVVAAACQSPEASNKELEALGDVLCALCCHDQLRGDLVQAGVVGSAAQLLGRSQDPDVRVRGLMALGMLLPADPEAQKQLLLVPGVVAQLLALMKQSEDLDCKVIARDVLGILTQDPAQKALVEEVVRQQLTGGGGAAAAADQGQ